MRKCARIGCGRSSCAGRPEVAEVAEAPAAAEPANAEAEPANAEAEPANAEAEQRRVRGRVSSPKSRLPSCLHAHTLACLVSDAI